MATTGAQVAALLVGQDAFRDERGRAHVIGIFDTVGAPQFPLSFQFAIYCRLYGEGVASLLFQIVDDADREVVRSNPVMARLSAEHGHEFFMSLTLRAEAPARFRVRALLDDAMGMEVPLHVEQGPDQWHHEGLPIHFEAEGPPPSVSP